MEDLMSVSSVSGATPAYPQPGQNSGVRPAFQQLSSALSSGDVQSAQQALSALQQGAGQVDSSSPLGQLLASLNSDLSSGNISGAQQSLQAFQQAHHHHHRPPPTGDAAGTGADATSSSTTSSTSSTSGSSGILA
jgi:hypothetical protein